MEDENGSNIFTKLRMFKYIYVLTFWLIFCTFYLCYHVYFKMNIPTIGSVIKVDIVQIHILFIEETMNLNNETFNEQTWYHILPEFGSQREYLRRLSSDIRGGKYYDIEMIRDITWHNFIDIVTFQKKFALVVCNALESRFEDNHIMITFKVLGLTNIPSRQINLANWGSWFEVGIWLI